MGRIRLFLKKLLLLAGIYLVMFLIIFYSKELSEGIKGGLNAAFQFILPSMFIFMIFSNWLMASGHASLAARPFRPLSRHLFRIPDSAAVIVLLSLIGGYPVGAKLLADEVKQGRLSRETASRMLGFCVNCGPAFLISGVGAGIFGSAAVGGILYLSQIAGCVAVGALSAVGAKREAGGFAPVSQNPPGKTVLLVSAVNDAIRSMAVICGFVVAFSAFLPVISAFSAPLPESFGYLLRGLLEVTTGCQNLFAFDGFDKILLAALFTGFGGICVHLQVCAMLKSTGISMKGFYLWRIPYLLVSLLTTKGLLRLLPGTVETLGIRHDLASRAFSVSPAATAFLILLCIMLLFFTGKSATLKEKQNNL